MPRRSPLASLRFLSRLSVWALLCFASAFAQSLDVSQSALTFTVTIGSANPPNQTVRVTSDTPRAFAAQKDPFVSSAWLTVFPSTGTTPADITFSVDASRFFAAGSQTVNVTISLPGTQPLVTKTVAVTAVVSGQGSGPSISVSPRNLAFSAASGAGSLPPQNIQVTNAGGGFLTYQLAVNYPNGAATGWLSVTPDQGSVQGGTGAPQITHAVGVNPTGLAPGTYNGSISVTGNAPNSPQVVLVTLTVDAPPNLLIEPSQLSFSASQGGVDPAPQTLTVSSPQSADITYQIASDQVWLTVEPTSGSTGTGSQTHTVSADISDLPQGNYTGNLTFTPANLPAINVAVSLTVARASAILTIPSALDFVGNSRIPLHEKRLLSIVNNPLAGGRWSARVVPPSVTWLKVSPSQGSIPGNLLVEVDNGGLGAATLEAQIEITQTAASALSPSKGGAAQTVGTALVPVTLTLLNQDPLLEGTPNLLEFSAVAGSTSTLQQILYSDNRGGPELNWQAQVATDNGGDWLSVTPQSGVAPTRTVVSANPADLEAGVYHGRVAFISGGQRVEVPVSLLVEEADGILTTDQSALYFEVQAGTPAVLEKTMRVMNRGVGNVNWTVQVREQSGTVQWLTVTPNSGNSESVTANPPQLTFAARADALTAGPQSALVEIIPSTGASRFVTVALNVLPSGIGAVPTLEPAGLAFVANSGGTTPNPQQLRIRSNQSVALGYLAGASTFSGGNWLQVQPANGNAAVGGANLEIGVNHAGLAPGIYNGLVGVTFGDGIVRSAPVNLTVQPAGSGCVPASTGIAAASPVQNFVAASGRATKLEVSVANDCGVGIEGAAVLATFNNADPPVPLANLGGGRYGATWTPRNAASQVNVRYEMVSGTSIGDTTVVGTVVSTAAPRLSQNASVNGASFARGEALAPGGIMSTFGFNLGTASTIAGEIPLPAELGGVSLFVGGVPAPLFFSSFGQLNSQAPFELTAPSRAQVYAAVNGQYTTPQEITIASARPGVFAMPSASGPPRAIAQNQDFSLNTTANPAARGDAVVLYLTGTGALDPEVATGEGAPSVEPLARVALPATATIGGKPAEILFLGLTPGFVGLTQANLTVPVDAPIGNDVPVVITIDGQPSNSMVIAVKAAAE